MAVTGNAGKTTQKFVYLIDVIFGVVFFVSYQPKKGDFYGL